MKKIKRSDLTDEERVKIKEGLEKNSRHAFLFEDNCRRIFIDRENIKRAREYVLSDLTDEYFQFVYDEWLKDETV